MRNAADQTRPDDIQASLIYTCNAGFDLAEGVMAADDEGWCRMRVAVRCVRILQVSRRSLSRFVGAVGRRASPTTH